MFTFLIFALNYYSREALEKVPFAQFQSSAIRCDIQEDWNALSAGTMCAVLPGSERSRSTAEQPSKRHTAESKKWKGLLDPLTPWIFNNCSWIAWLTSCQPGRLTPKDPVRHILSNPPCLPLNRLKECVFKKDADTPMLSLLGECHRQQQHCVCALRGDRGLLKYS